MEPVFFPFTYVAEPVARNLMTCFGRCTVFMPSGSQIPADMRLMVDKGWLRLVAPFESDDGVLAESLRDYRKWADLHGPGHLRQFVEQASRLPFFNAPPVSRLMGEIKARSRDSDARGGQPDSLNKFILKSRIFLSIAQEFDQRSRALHDDLAAVESMERNLFRHLRAEGDAGDVPPSSGELSTEDDSQAYLLSERLTAWTCFLFQRAAPADVFVTSSQPAVDLLIGADPEVRPVLSVNRIPVNDPEDPAVANWRNELSRYLSDLQMRKEKNSQMASLELPELRKNEATISLSVHRVDTDPLELFGRVAGIEDLAKAKHDGRQKIKTTLLVHVKRE